MKQRPNPGGTSTDYGTPNGGVAFAKTAASGANRNCCVSHAYSRSEYPNVVLSPASNPTFPTNRGAKLAGGASWHVRYGVGPGMTLPAASIAGGWQFCSPVMKAGFC